MTPYRKYIKVSIFAQKMIFSSERPSFLVTKKNIIQSRFIFPDLHYRLIFKMVKKKWKFSQENPKNEKKKMILF